MDLRTGNSWLLFTAVVVVFSHDAHAHPNHGPSWGERYLKLEISPGHARVVYGLTFSARYGRQIREIADRDDDGVITRNETNQFGASFTKGLTADVLLDIDDEPRAVAWSPPFVATLQGKLRRGPVALETAAKVKLAPGLHRIVITESAEFEGIYRTTVKIVETEGVKLLRAGRGSHPRGTEHRLVFLDLPYEGPPSPRVVSVEVELPGPTGLMGSRETRWFIIGVVGVLVVLLLGWVGRRFLKKEGSPTEPGTDTEP